jgi:DNA-binding MarR family transcriptional regulator
MPRPSTDPPDSAALAVELHDVVGKLRRRLREQADAGDLPPSQMSVLRRLERHGPATVSALARGAAMRPQSMGASVAALEAAGLVRREPDPQDGRQSLLSLTPACRKWLKDGRAARQDWLQRRIDRELDPHERQQLARALALLQRLADTHAVPQPTGEPA